jgi:hypothetical protein
MASAKHKHTQTLLDRLVSVRPTSTGWEASCPCRDDDRNPSLSVAEGDDGKVLLHCHRGNGCDVDKICSSVGLTTSDLWPPKEPEPAKEKDKLTFVKAYDYVDENGELLFQKVRYVNQYGVKTFRQRKPTGRGEWTYSLGDTPKVLYNLPAVLKAVKDGVPIWVVEGEKDADTLTEMGAIATTAPGGAGKWLEIHTASLSGATIDIIADNDTPGKEHAALVFSELEKAGCDVQVWVCPDVKDITDHIQSGKGIDDLTFFDVSTVENTKAPEEPAQEEQASDGDVVLSKISTLLDRSDLTVEQKLVKVSNALHSYSSTELTMDNGRLVNWEEFLKESSSDNYDWVIPWLLEKSERVIVVAAEGVGKTMLARQVAILAATGMHPFTYQRISPVKTLTVDLENPEKIIRRTSRSIQAQALSYGFEKKSLAELFTKPSGLDLLKVGDRILLEEQIEKTQPQILVMGPLYKSFVDPGGRTSEAIAVEVAKYLDYIRTTYGCALWLEHHAPLGQTMSTRDLRPFGSAVWSRWPEFGISLQPDFGASTPYTYDVRHFRGARDERPWPTKIKRGKRFPFEVIEFSGSST